MYIGYIFAWGVALCSPLYAFLLGLVDITLPELSVRGYIPSLWCILLIMCIEIVLFLCYTYHMDGIKYCKESRRYDTEWSTLQQISTPSPTTYTNTNTNTNALHGISTIQSVPTATSSAPYSTLSKEVIEERNETLRLVMDIQYPSPPPSLVHSRHGRHGRHDRGKRYKHRFAHLTRSYQGFTSSSTTGFTTTVDPDRNQQSQYIHRNKNNFNNKDDEVYERKEGDLKNDTDNLDVDDNDDDNDSSDSSSDAGDGDSDSTIPSIPSYKYSNTHIGLIVCELRKVYPPHTELSFKGVLTVLFSYGALILTHCQECLRVLVGRRQNMSGHNYDSIDNMNHTPTDINPTGDNTHLSELSSLDNKSATVVAVENICFSVKKGEIFGLLGSNGAGKHYVYILICRLLLPYFLTILLLLYVCLYVCIISYR